MTASDGPYGFSWWPIVTGLSYSSGACGSRGRAGGVPCCARDSGGDPTPIAAIAVATPPMAVRRVTVVWLGIGRPPLGVSILSALLPFCPFTRSSPAQIVLRKWQRANPLARGCKDRVGQRGHNWRQCRLAQSRRRDVRHLPVDLHRRHLNHAQQREVPEVVLNNPPLLDRYFLRERFGATLAD